VQLPEDSASGSVRFTYDGPAGRHELRVQYFDEDDGVSQYKLFVGGQMVDEWSSDNRLPTPSTLADSHTSIRRTVRDVELSSGDEIIIEGKANGSEFAAIDYVELVAGEE
jgi:alpha-glucuronidase